MSGFGSTSSSTGCGFGPGTKRSCTHDLASLMHDVASSNEAAIETRVSDRVRGPRRSMRGYGATTVPDLLRDARRRGACTNAEVHGDAPETRADALRGRGSRRL